MTYYNGTGTGGPFSLQVIVNTNTMYVRSPFRERQELDESYNYISINDFDHPFEVYYSKMTVHPGQTWIRLDHFTVNIVNTLRLKSLWPLASVWDKTTLNTGNVGGAGVDPQTWKMGSSFLMSLAHCIPIYSNFQ